MSGAVQIRAARAADAPALARLHVDTWRAAYAGLMPQRILDVLSVTDRTRNWRRIIRRDRHDPSRVSWLAEADGVLLGFASAGPSRDADLAGTRELYGLYVRVDRHGSGVAGLLTDAAIGDEPAFLWVLRGNERAIAFYRKIGFAPDGTVKTETRHGAPIHELRMRRGGRLSAASQE